MEPKIKTLNELAAQEIEGNKHNVNNFDGAEGQIKHEAQAFKSITLEDLAKILGLTIRKDETNKIITFLALLSAYTGDSQINVSFNAPSSTGKSFIPTEVAALFPEEDVIEVGYCSPTAFFHDYGIFDKEKGGYIVDLSRKILIFLDQPHTLLLQHLRPMLSHDKKEIRLKITDKSQKAGLRTKNIYLIGFPTVIFCSAGLGIDEQEATRFLLLSPEINQEKIREAVHEKIKKDTNKSLYYQELQSNPDRKLLIERIRAIKAEQIVDVRIGFPEMVEEMFLKKIGTLKPRHQRDIGRIISLIKVNALINLWFRERDGESIVANEIDIADAFEIWDKISESQELNLPPYVYNLYQDIIVPAFREKGSGISKKDIFRKHYEVHGRHLSEDQLRKQIIPMLEVSGLISEEPDPIDKRQILFYPTTESTISHNKNNSGTHSGVDEIKDPPKLPI
jgi:hypothetical protein